MIENNNKRKMKLWGDIEIILLYILQKIGIRGSTTFYPFMPEDSSDAGPRSAVGRVPDS